MITKDNSALLIIDIQGKLATLMHDRDSFFKHTYALIQGAQALEIPIIWAEQLPDKLGETVPEIAALLKKQQPLSKHTFSCCRDESIMNAINQTKKQHFLIAGIETHICVYQTVTDLIAQNKTPHVIVEATSSRTLSNKTVGINRMEKAGAIISSLEMCLFEILGAASGDQFKAIAKIVKF